MKIDAKNEDFLSLKDKLMLRYEAFLSWQNRASEILKKEDTEILFMTFCFNRNNS